MLSDSWMEVCRGVEESRSCANMLPTDEIHRHDSWTRVGGTSTRVSMRRLGGWRYIGEGKAALARDGR